MSELSVYINDQYYKIRIEPGWTTLYLVRNVLNLTGTKESCSEGDCGACTVVVGKWDNDRFSYKSVNSCIYPAAKLNHAHLITIEGLSIESEMHPIQDYLLKYHGSQCGFCTPGIVMSLFAMFSKSSEQTRETIYSFLEGNLCRCTGYQSILEAGLSLATFYKNNPDNYYNFLPRYCLRIQTELKQTENGKKVSFISSKALDTKDTHVYYMPESLEEYFNIREYNPELKVINGGTDIMVEVNIKRNIPEELIDISNIKELQHIEKRDSQLLIGSAVTYDQLIQNMLIKKEFPIFEKIVKLIASQQIRHTGTLSGNIANASPVGDMACVLLGLDAQLALVSHNSRVVKLRDFYLNYKMTILNPDEIIQFIILPLKKAFIHFEKSTKRQAVDISAVVSFFYIDEEYARLSIGGVASIPTLIEFERNDFDNYLSDSQSLIKYIQEQFEPIDDVRGSKVYRNLLIKNHIIAHLDAFKRGV